MNGWTPDNWNDFTVVGVVVAGAFGHMVAYIRGWLIPGRHHREIVAQKDEIVAQKDEAITDLRAGRKKDAETIQIQASTINKRDNVEETVTKLLKSVRESVSGQ